MTKHIGIVKVGLFAICFAVVGVIALALSSAATGSTAIEAEDGTLSAGTIISSDSTASAGNAVSFNEAVAGGSVVSRKLGLFPGPGAEAIGRFEEYAAWLGRPVDSIKYAGNNHGWHAPENWTGGGFEMIANSSAWTRPPATREGWQAKPEVVVATTLPLLPYHKGNLTDRERTEAFQKIIDGELDDKYRQIANNMLEANPARIVLRLGHEQEINYYPWSIRDKTPGDGYDDMHNLYKQTFQRVVGIFRSVSPDFKFNYQGDGPWNEIDERTGLTYMETAYPGDEYVDIIGVDIYDKRPIEQNLTKLTAAAEFAKSRGKQFSVPEWGLWANNCGGDGPDDGTGAGGDNPEFLQMMYDFLSGLPESGPGSLAYHIYFFHQKCVNFTKNDFPESAKLFKILFGPGTY